MESQLMSFVSKHYLAVSLIGLLGVIAAVMLYRVTGKIEILNAATLQFVSVVLMALGTPLILWLLSTKPEPDKALRDPASGNVLVLNAAGCVAKDPEGKPFNPRVDVNGRIQIRQGSTFSGQCFQN